MYVVQWVVTQCCGLEPYCSMIVSIVAAWDRSALILVVGRRGAAAPVAMAFGSLIVVAVCISQSGPGVDMLRYSPVFRQLIYRESERTFFLDQHSTRRSLRLSIPFKASPVEHLETEFFFISFESEQGKQIKSLRKSFHIIQNS